MFSLFSSWHPILQLSSSACLGAVELSCLLSSELDEDTAGLVRTGTTLITLSLSSGRQHGYGEQSPDYSRTRHCRRAPCPRPLPPSVPPGGPQPAVDGAEDKVGDGFWAGIRKYQLQQHNGLPTWGRSQAVVLRWRSKARTTLSREESVTITGGWKAGLTIALLIPEPCFPYLR